MGIGVFEDRRYHVARQVEDMARAAPDGMFFAQRAENDAAIDIPLARRMSFEPGLLDALHSSLLIVGAAGYGKTSFCRWHMLEDAQRFTSKLSPRLPAYVALHELADSGGGTFEDTFLRYVGKSAVLPAGLRKEQLALQQIRLYLDGLDEVPDPKQRAHLVRLAERGVRKWTNIQVVVTARDYVIAPWLSWLPRFNLADFTEEQVHTLADNWFDRDKGLLEVFADQLQREQALSRVLSVPLLATLVILIFRQTRNLPAGRTKLYHMFIDLHNEGWDLAKGIKRPSQFLAETKSALLGSVAYAAQLRGMRQLPETLMRSTVLNALRSSAHRNDWRAVVEELLRDGLLIRSGNTYAFAHLSYQEYLAAWHLRGDPVGRRATVLLGKFLDGDNWWKEVLCYYIGLSGNPKELREWVNLAAKKSKSRRVDTQASVLIREIGYAFRELNA
jgi:predicted NACHT family NTPase